MLLTFGLSIKNIKNGIKPYIMVPRATTHTSISEHPISNSEGRMNSTIKGNTISLKASLTHP